MSNRQFKTLLNQSKYVLFDYGNVAQLPEIEKQLAGVCRVQNIFYIKQRNSQVWIPLLNQQLSIDNIVYNIDNLNYGYFWTNFYGQLQQSSSSYSYSSDDQYDLNNCLFVWRHNQQKYIDCSFFRTTDNGLHYTKTNIPYSHIDNNTIIADFTGFTHQNEFQNQSFRILCK